MSNSWVRALSLVTAGLGLLMAFRWSNDVLDRTSSTDIADERPDVEEGSRVAPPLPDPRPAGVESRAATPPLASSEPERELADRLPPLDLEVDGLLGALRTEFDRVPLDGAVTASERAWVDAELELHAIEYLYFDVECTARLCRAETGFESILDLRDLGAVRLPESLSLVQSAVVRRSDRPGMGMVLYWGVGGQDLSEFAPPAE